MGRRCTHIVPDCLMQAASIGYSLGLSLAVRMSQPGQAKAIPGRPSGQLKSSQNRSQTFSERPTASQKLPEAVREASREHLGASPVRPSSTKRVPKVAPEHEKAVSYTHLRAHET